MGKKLFKDWQNNFLFLLTVLFLYSCSNHRSSKQILVYANSAAVPFLQDSSGSLRKMIVINSDTFPDEDSLHSISCILTTFSRLNRMDYRAVNALKRYLEAGGGGVVAIKDAELDQKGWPWLQQWETKKAGEKLQQDNSPLYILQKGYAKEELSDALTYAIGDNRYPDYKKAHTIAVPDSSRYTRIVLAQGLDEPLEMAVLPDNNVLFVERKGAVKIYDAAVKKVKTIASLNVFSGIEDGLLGVALDPEFSDNHWIYLYYAPAGRDSIDRLSRFELIGDSLLLGTEKIMLEIHTQRTYCCHSAGDVGFGPDGLLYVAVGDNTNADDPYKVGYQPVDERPGHELADDQGTAANTNDLRGKILRIKPEPDGTYSIPEGNLFPKGTPHTRPEIYVMGLRNPYRFTIDKKTNILYWGEVGPDTKVRGRDGSFMSYDEVNRAAKPGFYGWPYFLGNNDAFPIYDFATGKEGPRKDPAHPVNNSRNNTGLKELPPAQPAMIWYGKDSSKEFPLTGSGGASVMAGPVYHSDLFRDAPYKLSDYYDGKLFIFEWIRHWIMAVTLDKNGNYVRMEPFLDNMHFAAPIDMKFGPDGALYVLEYGTNWFAKNSDAKLLRIEYQEGNRNPVAVARADKQYGAVPLSVQLSAVGSKDYDKEDQLTYSWKIGNEQLQGKEVSYTFKNPGVHKAKLTVKDNHGGSSTADITVSAGNTPPEVQVTSKSNMIFYWNNELFDYRVNVKDIEDQDIDTAKINVAFNYLPDGKEVAVILSGGQQPGNLEFIRGQQLIASLDCKSCHAMDEKSVGPDFESVARRYAGQKNIADKLAKKIIEGGSGNWGTRQMSAHPSLPISDAEEIVHYILSLSENSSRMPVAGTIPLGNKEKDISGAYLLSASYTDKGANGIKPLQGKDDVVLHNPWIQAEDYDEGKAGIVHVTTQNFSFINGMLPGSHIKFNRIDLTGIKHLVYRVQSQGQGGNIELHIDTPAGRMISTAKIPSGKSPDYITGWKEITADVEVTSGIHDLYFVFTNPDASGNYMFNLDRIYFSNK
jgi:cytochrome c